jgi:hypothetical protein
MKDWKQLLGAIAPTIATALGSPLAGMATRAISGAILGKPDGSDEEIQASLAGADAPTLLKLKELDLQFKKDMAQMGIDLEKLAMDDRANARARQIAVRDVVPTVLAFGMTGALVVLMFMMLRFGVPGENRDTFTILLGLLGGAVTSVMSYYFGSSSGSAQKTEILSRGSGQR